MFSLDPMSPYIYNVYHTHTPGGVMFGPDFYIESIQNMKKVVANQIFKDKELNKAAHAYIDTQTQFVKTIAHNAVDLAKYSVEMMGTYWFPKKDGTA